MELFSHAQNYTEGAIISSSYLVPINLTIKQRPLLNAEEVHSKGKHIELVTKELVYTTSL